MTIQDFRDNPAVKEHLPQIIRPLTEMLNEHLVETCRGANPDAQNPEAIVGASKAIANLIKLFRDSAQPAGREKPKTAMKPLHRFDQNPTPPATSES